MTASLKRKEPVSSSSVFFVRLDVHQHVVGLVDLGRSGRPAGGDPVLDAMDRTAARGDDAAVALDHGGDLLALVRVDQKHESRSDATDCAPVVEAPAIAVRQGVPLGPNMASGGRIG